MKHPKSRGERRAVRDANIARRRFIATNIWSHYNEIPHEGSSSYQQWKPVEWGRYAKFNLNCGCKMCHWDKWNEAAARRRALDQAVIDNWESWQE